MYNPYTAGIRRTVKVYGKVDPKREARRQAAEGCAYCLGTGMALVGWRDLTFKTATFYRPKPGEKCAECKGTGKAPIRKPHKGLKTSVKERLE